MAIVCFFLCLCLSVSLLICHSVCLSVKKCSLSICKHVLHERFLNSIVCVCLAARVPKFSWGLQPLAQQVNNRKIVKKIQKYKNIMQPTHPFFKHEGIIKMYFYKEYTDRQMDNLGCYLILCQIIKRLSNGSVVNCN